jgi:hypothetical protein
MKTCIGMRLSGQKETQYITRKIERIVAGY